MRSSPSRPAPWAAATALIPSSPPATATLPAANPIDGVRALGLVWLGADVLLGPTGAALARLLSPTGGGVLVAASLLAWCIVPLALAALALRLRDF